MSIDLSRLAEALDRSWPVRDDNLTLSDRVVFMEAAGAVLEGGSPNYEAAAARFVEIVFGFDGDGGQHVEPKDLENVRAIVDAALEGYRLVPVSGEDEK